ncbi:phage protein NinX family protein [Proteus terrae]|uniref:phage protein NinX family protein n=1 Tax=Proteus terrae TaxID=1574161 RepID=UPI000D689EFD|nr:phage protein NinX family protein [Proteus terrae]
MNKYTELSDFEINKKVASHYLPCDYNLNEHAKTVELIGFLGDTDEYNVYGTFDPCNNPSDAMPIIKDNLISITHDGIAWDVSCAKYPELSVWNGLENYNDNFYRKAMELFLLIKDAENENNNNS